MSAGSPGMTGLPEIACQRGHGRHDSRTVPVTLGGDTAYRDLARIPPRLARSFRVRVYDWQQYLDMTDPRYCPASDVVSQTVDELGVWEPRETIAALNVCKAARSGATVIDIGAQIGWFTLLAASCGLDVLALDADAENLRILKLGAADNAVGELVTARQVRVGPDTEPLPASGRVALAKIDIEGAEDHAVRMLWPLIEQHRIDHLMIEVSPCFAGYYPALVADLLDAGYHGWVLPPKATPAHRMDDLPGDLQPWRLRGARDAVMAAVASWDQEDCWFSLPDAPWS